MDDHTRLFSYKMTHDTGFAPNPFHHVLTLACCKPGIRRTKQVGDWIAGFTSKTLIVNYNRKQKENRNPVFKWFKEEELIFLMCVEQKLTFEEYWDSSLLSVKKPNDSNLIAKTGDNIYYPTSNFDYRFRQITNNNHDFENMDRDLSGQFILISTIFYYFGRNSLLLNASIAPKLPKTQTPYGIKTHDESQARKFIRYVQGNYSVGMHGPPHTWPEDDLTWRQYESYTQ